MPVLNLRPRFTHMQTATWTRVGMLRCEAKSEETAESDLLAGKIAEGGGRVPEPLHAMLLLDAVA